VVEDLARSNSTMAIAIVVKWLRSSQGAKPMPDPRPAHHTMGPSLMNQPTPPFHGAAHSLYGPQGPTRSYGNLGRRREGPPQSLADHIDDALKHVAGLTPKQRLGVHNAMVTMCRDISFIKMIAAQAHGPYSEAAVQDEGRPL
jgi:hypothetical protein